MTTPSTIRLDLQLADEVAETTFIQPVEIGHYSQTGEQEYLYNNRSMLKCFSPPPNQNRVHYNLQRNHHTHVTRDYRQQKLDPLLKFLCDERITLQESRKLTYNEDVLRKLQQVFGRGISEEQRAKEQTHDRSPPDFVCYRGCLKTLLNTPYERHKGWKIAVTHFQGVHYICEYDTEEEKRKHAARPDWLKATEYWGRKFETYITADFPGAQPDIAAPVNNNEEFCSVVRSQLGQHSLVYRAEVDCYSPKAVFVDSQSKCRPPKDEWAFQATQRASEEGTTSPYIELKTSKSMQSENQCYHFRLKLQKWWAQSFLVNIPRIVCGFRDDKGIVRSVESYRTQDLPEIGRREWSKEACLSYADRFLTEVRNLSLPDDPKMVRLLEWNAGSSDITLEVTDSDEFCILPDWFIDEQRNRWHKLPSNFS